MYLGHLSGDHQISRSSALRLMMAVRVSKSGALDVRQQAHSNRVRRRSSRVFISGRPVGCEDNLFAVLVELLKV